MVFSDKNVLHVVNLLKIEKANKTYSQLAAK